MKDRDDDKPGKGTGHAADDDDLAGRRRESLFTDFDDEEEFEESDRDSDFDAMYTEIEEEEEADLDITDDTDDEWGPADDDLDDESDDDYEDSSPWDLDAATQAKARQRDDETDLWDTDLNPRGSFDDDPPEENPEPVPLPPVSRRSTLDRAEPWEDVEEEEEYEEEEERELNISLGMIVVAVFALILLGAGGYGIIEERANLQEEIRRLQADLATSAPPAEVKETLYAAAAANERNARLQEQVQELGRENRSLQAIISGLESQLTAQQVALEKQVEKAAPAPEPAPKKTAPAPQPVAEKPAPRASVAPAPVAKTTETAASGWFVNFSSYSQRGAADTWAGKLKPQQGQVVVAAAQSNGKNVYRVRVINLPDKAAAETVAAQLQRDFKTGKLWVGRAD